MSDKRRGLGRGLGALIPTAPTAGRVDRPVDVFFPEPVNGRDTARAGSAFGVGADGAQARSAETSTHEVRVDPRSEGNAAEVACDSAGSTIAGALGGDVSRETPADTPASRQSSGQPAEARSSSADVSRETGGQSPGENSDAAGSWRTSTGSAAVVADAGLLPVPGARFAELPVESITPNPRQPRTVFDEDEMGELVYSVAEVGVLQPVVVRPVEAAPDGSARYELVMGERRWRASQLAGLAFVPAIVRETGDDDLLRDALLENLHRSQLNPLEEAAAYSQLLEDFGCTHDVLATRIGRSRPQISNTLRLLRLPPLVQRRVAAGVLSAGHARALLGLDDTAAIERLAQRIVAEGLSVRAVEEIVALGGDGVPTRRPRPPRAGNRHGSLDELAQRLSDRFDTRVQIALGRRKGRLSVEFASVEDLNRIVQLLAPGDEATLGNDGGSTGADAAHHHDGRPSEADGDIALEAPAVDDMRHGREDEERAAG